MISTRLLARLLGGDGAVDGQRGLARPAFLRHE